MFDGIAPETGIDFRSDNTGRAAPEILEAMLEANRATALGYGRDRYTAALQERFSEVFETAARVFPIATGTAANALALAAISPSWGLVYCSEIAHAYTSEVNATAFFGGGVKLVPVAGSDGKVNPAALQAHLDAIGKGLPYVGVPAALHITQATDRGTVWTIDEIRAVTQIARARGLRVHMDGARLANALSHLACTPAEVTWKSGVDILSLGAAKNGGALADAIVVFSDGLAEAMAYELRRAGHTWSKMRFAAAQLHAYVEDGLWLRMAHRANEVAAYIARNLLDTPGLRLRAPVEANILFVELDPAVMDKLEADGILFFRREPTLARFVCRFDTTAAEADALLESLRRHHVSNN